MANITLRVGVHTANRYSRVYRVGVFKYTYGYRDRMNSVIDLCQCVCNNCKGRYWTAWQDDTIPRYCPKCRNKLRELWRGKYWDDETDEIPF
jgi:hypothetical protein